ncbi:MAG: short-subunit dehydrogenase [Thermoproteota archaeon]|jgi:short-subunit dehydrogenase
MNIIIAGASKGVGFSYIDERIKMGDRVFAIARTTDSIEEYAKSLSEEERGKLEIIKLDLTNIEEVDVAFSKIKEKSNGARSALLNCCATWTGGVFVKDITPNDMLHAIQLNFMSCYNATYNFINKLPFSVSVTNTVITLGATASIRGGKKTSSFAVGKSSLRILSQSLAKELGPEGLHVSHIIIDGLIHNDRTLGLNPERDLDKYISMSSLIDNMNYLISQKKDAWTLELDIRPFNESF